MHVARDVVCIYLRPQDTWLDPQIIEAFGLQRGVLVKADSIGPRFMIEILHDLFYISMYLTPGIPILLAYEV